MRAVCASTLFLLGLHLELCKFGLSSNAVICLAAPCRFFLRWWWSHPHTDVWTALCKLGWSTLQEPNPVCGTNSRAGCLVALKTIHSMGYRHCCVCAAWCLCVLCGQSTVVAGLGSMFSYIGEPRIRLELHPILQKIASTYSCDCSRCLASTVVASGRRLVGRMF